MAKIFINPGHGYPDPGAVNRETGLEEASVALAVGDAAARYLSAVGHEVELWQDDDLNAVIREANDWGADIFLSIHCNSVADPNAHGTETFFHPNDGAGKIFADCIQSQMIGEFGLRNRGIKTSTGLGVLNWTDMPAALAEMAFISNPEEVKLLANETERWGACLARGCTDYCAAVGI